jgi:GMP reductase
MILHEREELDFDDVMMLPLSSDKGARSRDDVELERVFPQQRKANRSREWAGIPVIAANMDTVGTFEVAKVMMDNNCCTALHKHYSAIELADFFKATEWREKEDLLFYTMGIGESDMDKLREFTKYYDFPQSICIDVANGYMPHFVEAVAKVRKFSPNAFIMAGNVVSGDHTRALINAGASVVKVGIGSGSACTTRRMTGVGRPQFSAVEECARAAHSVNGLICSDGGCVYPGDIAKAIGAGADFVMLGGMLAGHDECGGKKIMEDVPFKSAYHVTNTDSPIDFPRNTISVCTGMEFYGMSSGTAMEKHNGGVDNYKASEGRTLTVPYKGSIDSTIKEILGGIRSNMTYIGADKLKHISKCAEFVKVRRQLNTSLSQYES